jgi:aldose 1-epimerase
MKKASEVVAGLMATSKAGSAKSTTADRSAAGTLTDGTAVEVVTLANTAGVSAHILTYGATLQSLMAPDRNDTSTDIVLGFDSASEYERHQAFIGVTIGRYANRIGGGQFILDGKTYRLPTNDGAHSLHGGGNGFDRVVWAVQSVQSGPPASVVLSHTSSEGASGYPGEVIATVTYSLDEAGDLAIAFEATTSEPTILNMTNHALFNLAGGQSAMNHRLTVPAEQFTPVDATLIPTGELRPVRGTAFDFTTPHVIAEQLRNGGDKQIRIGRGYDHNFVLAKGQTSTPELAARLEDADSGRVVEVLTTEPGLQLYTGNYLNGTLVGKQGRLYRMGDGIALEPQKFPDTPNRPSFGSARVDPGEPYRHVMIYRMSVSK